MEIRSVLSESKNPVNLSLLSTLFWGLLAHAYAFLHDFFSHDSLNALFASATEDCWKLELGRILVPVYRVLVRGPIAIPWIIGCLSLFWLFLSVLLVTKIFSIRSRLGIILIAGIMTTNATVTALAATYIYELDIDMLSILLSTLAVYLWKAKKRGYLWGSLCIAATLGIYQCNVSVAICLIMMDCILACLRNESTIVIIKRGALSIIMILIGAAVYYLAMHTALKLFHVTLAQGYNSITNAFMPKTTNLAKLIRGTYTSTVRRLLIPKYISSFPAQLITISLGIVTVIVAILSAMKNHMSISNILLAIALTALLPIGSNLAYILNDRVVHDLMYYATWMYLAFPLFMIFSRTNNEIAEIPWKGIRLLITALLVLTLFNNCLASNTLYIKKDLEQKVTLSMMTRVVYDIYNTEGYEDGVTEICFIGVPTGNHSAPGFDVVSGYTGAGCSNAIAQDNSTYYYNPYRAYLRYYLNVPIQLCSDEMHKTLKSSDTVKQMPCYPSTGSIMWIDGILVVKMS